MSDDQKVTLGFIILIIIGCLVFIFMATPWWKQFNDAFDKKHYNFYKGGVR